MRKNYYSLNPILRGLIDLLDLIKTKIKSFRFPLKGFIILTIIASLIGLYIYDIVSNKFDVAKRESYNKEGFKTAEQIQSKKLSYQNNRYSMEMDVNTTTLTVKDLESYEVWTSNLKKEGSDYPDQFVGLNETTKDIQQSSLIVNYAVMHGKIESMNNYRYSIANNTFKIRTNDDNQSIEILYQIGDFSVDYRDLPMFISIERFENMIIANVEKIEDEFTKDDAKIMIKLYKKMEDKGFYILTNPSAISKGAINELYNIFYNYCDYNSDELAYDNKQYNIENKPKTKFFEVALLYTLTPYGFNAKIVNESILENDEYPLVSIDLLPYFAAGSVLDSGYMFIPDGSGSLINYNNNKTYALGYSRRYYGDEMLFSPFKQNKSDSQLLLPIYGAKRNNQAYLAIIEDGASLGYLMADISMKKDSYNVIYPRFYYRESQQVNFGSGTSKLTLYKWTKFYSLVDYNISFNLLSNENANYNKMADIYSTHLFNTTLRNQRNLSLDLTLLGGYTKKETFLGIPYTKVASLTSTKEAKSIVEAFKEKNINNLNLVYDGWFNGGMNHYNVGYLDYNDVVGSLNDFKNLNQHLSEQGINFYPEINFTKINTLHKYNKDDSAKDLFSAIVEQHPYDSALAAKDLTKAPFYYLNPSKYKSYMQKFLSSYNKSNINGLGLKDVGNLLIGSYAKSDYSLRNQSLAKLEEVLTLASKDHQLMTKAPADYAIKYSSLVLDAPIKGNNFNIIDRFIPFYHLVLAGKKPYSLKSININDEVDYNYQKLKLIETGANLAMTLSYHKTTDLINTDFNRYYSTYYLNWVDKTCDLYQEIMDLDIGSYILTNHEFVTNDVVMVTYSNGKKIMINYGSTSFNGINPSSYKEVV